MEIHRSHIDILDALGNPYPWPKVDGYPAVATISAGDAVARGTIAGSDRVANLAMLESCVGPVNDVRQKTTIWPWAGIGVTAGSNTYKGPGNGYHPALPAAPMSLYAVSTSANDTLLGSGCRTLHVHYLDGSFVEHGHSPTVSVNMNGTAPVLIANDVYRVNKLVASSFGATGQSEGDILIVEFPTAGSGLLYHGIPMGRNVGFCGIYTVPAGKQLMLSRWTASANAMGDNTHFAWIAFAAKQGCLYQPFPVFLGIDATSVYNSTSGDMTFDPVVRVMEKIDMRFTVEADIGAGFISCAWHGWYENI